MMNSTYEAGSKKQEWTMDHVMEWRGHVLNIGPGSGCFRLSAAHFD
jgi:hypothetical protein